MKIKELQRYINEKKIDFCLFYNLDSSNKDTNMYYFTDYKGIGALVIGKKKKYLIVPEIEYERAKKCKIKVHKWKKKKRLFELIHELNKKNRIKNKRIGIDKEKFTLRLHSYFKKHFKKCRSIDISDVCLKLREIKTKNEIETIRKACNITDKILKKCFGNFNKFKTELDVASFLEDETKKYNCELAFNPIVASGSNSSIPHYEPRNVKLKNGFCVIDFGIKHKEYCSDITRTVYTGEASRKEIEIYGLVLDVQKNIIKDIKEGARCSKLVETAKKTLGKYNKRFIHGLGHGIGLEVHELPNLKEESKDLLKNGVIFSVEPGIYFPKKFGIRIEDDVLIKRGKKEVLTKTTKNLLIFKKK